MKQSKNNAPGESKLTGGIPMAESAKTVESQPPEGKEETPQGPPEPYTPGPAEDEATPQAPQNGLVMFKLSAIKLEPAIHCRDIVNKATVALYAERMKAKDAFPPLDVFKVDGDHLLVDGCQRYYAATGIGLTALPVRLHQGTRQEAIRFALQANNTHGLPRTNKDKRRAVEMALHEFGADSDHLIADMVKVSHVFVGKVRHQLETVTSSDTRTGRDGKKRKVRHSASKATCAEDNAEDRRPESSESQEEQADQEERITKADVDSSKVDQTPEANSDEFCFAEEWPRIEEFLNTQLQKWPEDSIQGFVCELRRFAERIDPDGGLAHLIRRPRIRRE